MKNEGWTLSDLDGELRARGMDLDEVDYEPYLDCATPEEAARVLSEDKP